MKTVTGNPIVISDAKAGAVESLKVALDFQQDLNGYDQPWPGGGGRNLIDATTVASRTVNGITLTNNGNGTISASGTSTATVNVYIRISPNLPTGNYLFYACTETVNKVDSFCWDTTEGGRLKKWDETTNSDSDTNGTPREIRIVSGHEMYLTLRIYSGVTVNNYLYKPMLLKGTEVDTSWEPYSNICSVKSYAGLSVKVNGDDNDVAFPRTVYKASVDVTNGQLYMASVNVHLGDLAASYISSINTSYIDTIGMLKAWMYLKNVSYGEIKAFRTLNKGYCNALKCDFIEGGHPLNASDSLWQNGAPNVLANTSAYPNSLFYYIPYGGTNGVTEATTSAIKQWFADNDVYLQVELINPEQYTLTPKQISLLEGANTISTDFGLIELSYNEIVDTTEYNAEITYLLDCMVDGSSVDPNFTPKSRVGDLLYSYLAGTTPTIYTDPVESRVEHLMKYWLGFESKSSYISLPPRSRVEAILSSKIEGTSYTGETLSDVEKLLIRITI